MCAAIGAAGSMVRVRSPGVAWQDSIRRHWVREMEKAGAQSSWVGASLLHKKENSVRPHARIAWGQGFRCRLGLGGQESGREWNLCEGRGAPGKHRDIVRAAMDCRLQEADSGSEQAELAIGLGMARFWSVEGVRRDQDEGWESANGSGRGGSRRGKCGRPGDASHSRARLRTAAHWGMHRRSASVCSS